MASTPVAEAKPVDGVIVEEARCDCGWRLPRNIVANVRLKSLQVQYECPECETGFVMIAPGAK